MTKQDPLHRLSVRDALQIEGHIQTERVGKRHLMEMETKNLGL